MPRVSLRRCGRKLLGENGNVPGSTTRLVLPSTRAPSKAGSGAPTKGDRIGPDVPPSIGAARRNLVSCSHDELTISRKL